MALITCPECGSRISEYATMCISCGCPMVKIMDIISQKAVEKRKVSIESTPPIMKQVKKEDSYITNVINIGKDRILEESRKEDEKQNSIKVENGDVICCFNLDISNRYEFEVRLKRNKWYERLIGLKVNDIFVDAYGRKCKIERIIKSSEITYDYCDMDDTRSEVDKYAPHLAKDNYGKGPSFGKTRKWL